MQQISFRLDKIASDLMEASPDLEKQKPRQKALTLAAYLRAHNLTGLKDLRDYHALQNNFIGRALYSDEHSSLPLISTAIFCSVAKRINLDARPCGFPFHVYSIVKPPNGFDIDGNPWCSDLGDAKIMYMDPFRTDEEIPVEYLRTQFTAIGASADVEAFVMGPALITEIVLRCARNILTSVRDTHQHSVGRNAFNGTTDQTDREGAFYSALWASLLLGASLDGNDDPVLPILQRRTFLPHIVEYFETYFPTDASLVEQYIVPLFENVGEHAQLRDAIRVTRAGDAMPKQIKPRKKEISQQVRYKVGQVFQHKRYDYVAVITGWDVECSLGPQWEQRMRIHELPRGRQQSFYHVL
jgi:F-box protein 21